MPESLAIRGGINRIALALANNAGTAGLRRIDAKSADQQAACSAGNCLWHRFWFCDGAADFVWISAAVWRWLPLCDRAALRRLHTLPRHVRIQELSSISHAVCHRVIIADHRDVDLFHCVHSSGPALTTQ